MNKWALSLYAPAGLGHQLTLLTETLFLESSGLSQHFLERTSQWFWCTKVSVAVETTQYCVVLWKDSKTMCKGLGVPVSGENFFYENRLKLAHGPHHADLWSTRMSSDQMSIVPYYLKHHVWFLWRAQVCHLHVVILLRTACLKSLPLPLSVELLGSSGVKPVALPFPWPHPFLWPHPFCGSTPSVAPPLSMAPHFYIVLLLSRPELGVPGSRLLILTTTAIGGLQISAISPILSWT
jgi:hypothetical protein